MIITGGFNVYSAEVEQAVLEHPDVQDCGVIGLPDDKWGERVTAIVQLRPGHQVTAGELTAFVKESAGQREGAQTGGDLAGPAAVEGRQGTQGRDQEPADPSGRALTG